MVSFDTTYFTRLSAWITAIVLIFCFIPQVNAQNGNADDLLTFEIVNPEPSDSEFGRVMAMDGDYAVIAGGDKIYFYFFDGNSWDIITETSSGGIAESVAIDNGIVAVGYPNTESIFNPGTVNIFVLNNEDGGGGRWELDEDLRSNLGSFGFNVAVKNGMVAIANPTANIQGESKTGVVRIYKRGRDSWFQADMLTAPLGDNSQDFGAGLSFNENGTELVVASKDEEFLEHLAYHFVRNNNGTWAYNTSLQYGIRNRFTVGARVPIDFHDDVIAVGAVPEEEVRLFTRELSGWSDFSVLTSESVRFGRFGVQVEMIDGFMAVSVPANSVVGRDGEGSVVLFAGEGASWDEVALINNPKMEGLYADQISFDENGRLLSTISEFQNSEIATVQFVLPVEPNNLSAGDGDLSSTVELSWNREAGRDGFRIYERGIDQPIDVIESSSAAIYRVENLASGTVKEYGVSSYNAILESPIQWDIGYTRPNGRLVGTITSQGGGGMPNALVRAEPDADLQGATFDGSGLISIPHQNSLNLRDTLSVEALIRVDGDLSQRYTIFSTQAEAGDGGFSLEAEGVDEGSGRLAIYTNGNVIAVSADTLIKPDTYHHVAYVREADTHVLYVDGDTVAVEINAATFTNNEASNQIGAGPELTNGFAGEISEVRLWDDVRTPDEINDYKSLFLGGNEDALLAYWRLNGELDNSAVDWSGNGAHGELINSQFDLSDAALAWGAYTNIEGAYEIPDIRYSADGTDFVLTPSFGMNEYDPVSRTRTLDRDQSIIRSINFTDITSFSISGVVTFDGSVCVAPNVDIELNGVVSGTTDEDGFFNIAVLQTGENVIRPVFGDHPFEPAERTLNVINDIENADFVNQQRRGISGQVAGGDSRLSIGTGQLTATGANDCLVVEASTDEFNDYSMELPALPELTLEATVPSNSDITFQVREINLSDTSATEDFIYRTEPIIALNGLPEPIASCDIRVLEQLENYFVEIEAFEEYGDDISPVETGQILINNGIADSPNVDTLQINNGTAIYEFNAGSPNIVGGGEKPYQKLLSMEVQTGDEEVDAQYSFNRVFDEWAVVEGTRPRERTFTTVSPQIPFFILRDPPGDQSYSFLSEGQSECRTMSLSRLTGDGSSVWAKIKVGTKFEAGFALSVETEIWGEIGTNLTMSATQISQDEVETCLNTDRGFSTADSDQFTGEDGDLYVGAAMNILYAITDVLEYNLAACRVDLSRDIIFGNEDFATEYIYTESHIRDVVIPDLDRIRSVPGVSADSVAFLTDQIDLWHQTLDMNKEIKEDLFFVDPIFPPLSISPGSGTEYSETSTISNSRSIEFNMTIDEEAAAELGAEAGGSGISGGTTLRVQTSMGEAETVQRTQTNTVGFFLEDDDPGDSFSVAVKSDPVFGTFVFELIAGTSSCPWEPGTLPRDGTQLTVDSPTQVDVPEDQPAVFRLTLGNTGQNDEVREYRLDAITGSNPDGAVIRLNGSSIADNPPINIPPGSSQDVTLTIDRGPLAFDYENLEILMRSTCDAAIADTVALTVRFQSSCSPMELDFPEDNWVVNAGSGDELEIELSGYDRAAFNNILLQYRLAGQNSWTTSPPLIESGDMPNNSATLQWDVSNIDDGEYDFRVAIQCDAGVTYTSSVSGSIRRSGLLVEGLPSPSDEILNIGEVIDVTFNRNIEPASVISENVKLVDLTTGERIASAFVVGDRRITITPEVESNTLQNRLLQASVSGVVDITGNPQTKAATWKFRVRQNPIAWNRSVLRQNILLGDGESTTLTAELTNQSATEESFAITSTPEWLDAVTTSGTLLPEESLTLAFLPDPLLGAGMYRDTVVAETSLGNENLIVEYGIQCEPPAWELDEPSFANSMSLVADFYIGDVPFSKENDIVAAFVGDELRGVSRVVPSIPSDTSASGYLYTGFLTIFSNQSSGDEVTFRLWDSAACQVMDIANTLEFQSDAMIGSADSPEQFTVSGAVLQSVPVVSGNNWISLGVEATNMSVNSALSRVRARDGDVIMSQAGFNQYVLGAGWVGRIDSLDPGIMYKMILENESSLDLIGQPVDGDDRPISVNEGWNWIGYLPDEPLPLDDALASLSHSNGDRIRSQTYFSEFSGENNFWVGNLSSMTPGAGYKLFRNESGTLTYPGAVEENSIEIQNMSIAQEPGWEVNASDYEQVMAVTGRLTLGGDVITGNSAWLSAWIDGELRGVTRAVKVLDQWLYFMNINGDRDEGEPIIEFKAWHPELGLYEDLSGSVTFNAESVVGSPREPIELFGEVVTSSEETFSNLPVSFELNQNYPNPFNPTTQIDFALPEASDVRLEIYNVIGQRVSILVNEQRTAGYHNVRFDASGLASGVYFYRIQAGSFVKTQKMMLVK